MVEGVINNALPTFLLFYVTSVVGMSGALAGLAIAIGTIVDALLDPLIGSRSDNLHTRLGRRLPFMLAGLPIAAVTLVLTFALPSSWPEPLLFTWLTLVSIVLRTSLSLYGIPYQAVAAELTEDYTERSNIMALRWGAGLVAGLFTVAIGFNLFFVGEGGLSKAVAYLPFGVTIATLATLAGAMGCWAVYQSRNLQHQPVADSDYGGLRVFREVGEVFKNPSFRALASAALLLLSSLSFHQGLGIHAGTLFWRLEESQLQILPLVTLVGLVFGTPLSAPLSKRFGKRSVAIVGFSTLFLTYLLPPTLRVTGLLPLEGMALVSLLAVNAFIVGALMSAAVIAVSSMLADATDEHEYLFGARREGLYFASWLFAGKTAGGLGVLGAGLILQFVNFPTSAADVAARVVSAQSLTQFGLFYGLVPGVLALGSVIAMLFYRLTAAKHSAIVDELHIRRGERQHADLET
jgi:GPH family glycoside/pentoside/hexuronide:cation symporter